MTMAPGARRRPSASARSWSSPSIVWLGGVAGPTARYDDNYQLVGDFPRAGQGLAAGSRRHSTGASTWARWPASSWSTARPASR